MRRRPAIRLGVAGLTCFLALLLSCSRSPSLDAHVFSGRKLGTTYSIKIVEPALTSTEQQQASHLITAELDRINAIMSTYQETSELSKFNQARGGVAVELSPELFKLFVAAREAADATDGAFDITIGPLVNAWGFGPKGTGEAVPSPEVLEETATYTGWETLRFDEAAMSVEKSDQRVYCDLSGIAKGYAVDCVSKALFEAGFTNHMVEVGGEVQALGVNASGQPWRIGVERPVAEGRTIQRVLPLRNSGMATSGDYRNFFDEEGIRYSHIIDPRSGAPVRHQLGSVTVVADSCMRADAFATALMVLGEKEGLAAAEENNLAALFLVRAEDGSFNEVSTVRFRKLFGNE